MTVPVVTEQDIQARLRQTAAGVEMALARCLDDCTGAPGGLVEAMRYSLLAGGKRLRPALVLWSCAACDGDEAVAMPAAVAVECVHTFSLIHDDLPALDNDDLRRGKPSCHKKFGEAVAILAGDALLALAFEIIGRGVRHADTAAAMTRELAEAAGCRGMIGGETADLAGESRPPDRDLVASIHAAKTARLLESSCRLGGLAAGADPTRTAALAGYGLDLGLAFQATDDLLDVTATSEAMGKRTNKDAASGKQTYPRAVGIDETRKIAVEAAGRAAAALEPFGSRAAPLAMLARFVVERET